MGLTNSKGVQNLAKSKNFNVIKTWKTKGEKSKRRHLRDVFKNKVNILTSLKQNPKTQPSDAACFGGKMIQFTAVTVPLCACFLWGYTLNH